MNREMVLTYLRVLIQSTEKKEAIITQLTKLAKQQEQVAQAPSFEMDSFTSLLDEKETWIQELATIDDGFGQTFDRIKDTLVNEKQSYETEIKQLQQLIGRVTKKAVELQALERRNKLLVERRIAEKKQRLKTVQVSSKAAGSYYQNMANRHYNQSYFLDQKR